MKNKTKAIRRARFYGKGTFLIFSYDGTENRLWGWCSLNSPLAAHVLGKSINPAFGYQNIADIEQVEL